MDFSRASSFQYSSTFKVTKDIKEAFDENGYIVVKNILSKDEVSKLKAALESDDGVLFKSHSRDDGQGRQAKVSMWKHPGNDITGIVARSEKIAGTMEKLLEGEVYHYHAKVILKEARTGGAHVWHQDYGYWYQNGCLFPQMGTVWLAIDKADKENGCLEFIHRSHKVGRIDHVRIGEQVGADLARLQDIRTVLPSLHCELGPGDAVFFHCNLLHCSAQNNSDRRRWAYLMCYNTKQNNPVRPHHLPQYTPLNKVPNDAISKCTTATDMTGKEFFGGPKEDESLKSLDEKKKAES